MGRKRSLGDFWEGDPRVTSWGIIGNPKLRRKKAFFTDMGSGVRKRKNVENSSALVLPIN